MKLTRLTAATLQREIASKRAKGETQAQALGDKQLKRDAIDAWLLDGTDVMILLGIKKNDITSTIAKYRTELRTLGDANDA